MCVAPIEDGNTFLEPKKLKSVSLFDKKERKKKEIRKKKKKKKTFSRDGVRQVLYGGSGIRAASRPFFGKKRITSGKRSRR